jgi:hypothetical protein
VYRLHGLDPGKYWVRSVAATLEDGSGWLPTFGPQTREIRDARIHQVTVDADTTDTDVNPEPGMLFHLSGKITCDGQGPVIVTPSSETGRRSAASACMSEYLFEGLAPAVYEVSAMMQGGGADGFHRGFLDQNSTRFTVPLCRFVIPLDSLQLAKAADAKRRGQTAFIQKSSSIPSEDVAAHHSHRETPLEALLPKKPKTAPKTPAPPNSDQTPPVQAPKKKTSRTSKPSRARTPRKKEIAPSKLGILPAPLSA